MMTLALKGRDGASGKPGSKVCIFKSYKRLNCSLLVDSAVPKGCTFCLFFSQTTMRPNETFSFQPFAVLIINRFRQALNFPKVYLHLVKFYWPSLFEIIRPGNGMVHLE